MKRILALLLLLLMSAACAESAPLPYAIESGFLIFPAEDGKQPVPIAVKDGFAAKAQELADCHEAGLSGSAAGGCGHIGRNPAESAGDAAAVCVG